MTPLLAIDGLGCARGGRQLLDGVSFEVQRGELFGLLGPNGAGKSTVLRILLGLWKADAGSVWWEGQKLAFPYAALRAQLGIVFQSSTLDALLTARENLLLSGRLYSVPGAMLRKRVDELLNSAGLLERADERVGTWSGGMRRRLELARALLHSPKLLLMDEPTTGLDEAAFRLFWRQVQALRAKTGLSVVMSTHRPEEAKQCDRLLVLNEGRTVVTETPEALARRVGGDVVTLEVDDAEGAAQTVREKLQLEAKVVNRAIRLEHPQGHVLIPRLVEALEVGAVKGVSLHPPSLADAFFSLTGTTLPESAERQPVDSGTSFRRGAR